MKSQNDRPALIATLFRPILIGTLCGALSCLALLLLSAYIASCFEIPAPVILPIAVVMAACGAFIGAFIGAKTARKNGWLIGIIVAVVLFLVSLLAGIGLFAHLNGGFVLTKLLIMVGVGFFGGIVAVNSSGKNKRKR